jgi:hypothetical protein
VFADSSWSKDNYELWIMDYELKLGIEYGVFVVTLPLIEDNKVVGNGSFLTFRGVGVGAEH